MASHRFEHKLEITNSKPWPPVKDIYEDIGAPAKLPPANDNMPVSMLAERQGDWMQTFTGRKFWPMDPRAEDVCIEDIAHSLAMQCRYRGHCMNFYSVAEHSLHVAWYLFRHAGPETAMWGLMHDAAEAYLVDVHRPLKNSMPEYKAAETKVMAAICEKFGLPREMPRAVKEVDDWIMGDEVANLVPMEWHDKHTRHRLGIQLEYLGPHEAERRFLKTFAALRDELREMVA